MLGKLLCVLGIHDLMPMRDAHPEKATNSRVDECRACKRCDAWFWFAGSSFSRIKIN